VTIGVLALQGDVREHLAALRDVGASARTVRTEGDLDGVDGLILPGGESTTLSLLLTSSGLFDPLAACISTGMPVFGTCAGLVLLAKQVRGGRADQRSFGVLDVAVLRNGYGRQAESFETVVELSGELAEPGRPDMPAVFIRAPLIEEVRDGVAVLGTAAAPSRPAAAPVICRQGNVLASCFHPELTPDRRLHQLFVSIVSGRGDIDHGVDEVPAGLTR
jgi:5'-phosphate synthase pdxT subunit